MSRHVQKPDDSHVSISLFGSCNNSCVFCPANLQWPTPTTEELSNQILEGARKGAKVVRLTHGEPTIRRDVVRLIKLASKLDMKVSLATNGRAFAHKETAQRIVALGVTDFTVSLHGPKDVHDRVTRCASHEQTLQGIRNLVSLDAFVTLSTVLTRPLVEDVSPEEWSRHLEETGAHRFVLQFPQIEDALPMPHSPDLELPREDTVAWLRGFHRATSHNPAFQWRLFSETQERPKNQHVAMRPGNLVSPFSVESCPYRLKQRRFPAGPEALFVQEEKGIRLWRSTDKHIPLQLIVDAKLVWGEGRLALHSNCRTCPRLHQCPALFEPVTGNSAKSKETIPSWTLAEDPPSALAAQVRTRGTLDTTIPVPEIWLESTEEENAPRPRAFHPVFLLKELRKQGIVPTAYHFPEPGRAGGLAVSLATRENAHPTVASHHEGMSLQLTESCMCRCIMCNIVGHFKKPLMDLPTALRVLHEGGMLGMQLADLFGGEVTLRRDLFFLLKHVSWLSMQPMFITTGYYLTPAYVRELQDAGAHRVVVSIDGSRPEIHDAIRRLPGIWKRTVRALKSLAGQNTIEAFASTVILSENLFDLPDLLELTGRIGIKKHEFFLPITGPISSTIPRWPDPGEAETLLDEILPEMEEVAKRFGMTIDFRPDFRRWGFPREETLEMISTGQYNVHQRNLQSRCQAPGWNLFITTNGNVYPCDMPAVIGKDNLVGNIETTSLVQVLQSEEMRAFQDNAGHHPACRMCVGRYEALR